MNKAIKISAVIAAVILLVCLGVFIFVPGIFTYIRVSFKYDHINDTVTEFPLSEIPDDFVTFETGSVTVKMPKGTAYNKTSLGVNKNALKYNDKVIYFINETDSTEVSEYLADYDPYEYFENSEDDYRHFFKTIGAEFPKDTTEQLFFTKEHLNAKMCLKLRGKDLKVFREMAETKEGSFGTENTWKMTGDGFTAYVGEIFVDPVTGKEGQWDAVIYPEKNPNKHYFILLNAENEEMSRQIMSSIKLT